MPRKQLNTLLLLGVGTFIVYYLMNRKIPIPADVTVTPINPALVATPQLRGTVAG